MGRPGLSQNKKFRRLALEVKSSAAARGHLELMWDSAYEAGDEVLGDSLDVELAAGWHGEPGFLTSLLARTGFLDEQEGVYSIHDFWHHAPAYVRKRRTRENERRSKVDPCLSTDQSMTSHGLDVDHKTAPLPHPHPHPKDIKAPTAEAAPTEKASPKKAWKKGFPEDILDATSEIMAFWPNESRRQPNSDSRVPRSSGPQLAARLAKIKQSGGELSVCVEIAKRAVDEFEHGKWAKAAENFFGKSEDAPWLAYYQAHTSNLEASNAT